MKRLILFFLIVISASILIHPVPTAQARGGGERTGIVSGTITFVDLVCDTVLFVPRFVFKSLFWPGHDYRSRHDQHHYRHDSHSYREDYDKKGRRGRKGRGRH